MNLTSRFFDWRRVGSIVFKELKQLSRDKMTFGMVVMIPVIQLLLFGYAINTKIRDIPVGLVDQNKTVLSRYISQSVSATQIVRIVRHYNSAIEAEDAIRQGKIRAALIIPQDLPTRFVQKRAYGQLPQQSQFQSEIRPVAQWIVDGSDTVIAGAISGLRNMPLIDVDIFTRSQNQVPANFEVVLYYNPEQRTVVNTVPGLIGVILTMTMVMFTSAAIVRERERGNLEFLIATPVKSIELMIGKIIPYIFVGLLQMSIVLALGYFIFSVPIMGSLFNLGCVSLLFIFASLTLGLFISTVAKTQLQSTQMTIFILLPSILLSGFMFPYEGMPRLAQWIAEILPATHYMRMVRGVILRDASVVDLSVDAMWLTFFTVAMLIVASYRFKKRLD